MAFKNLTRGEDNGGFQILEKRGITEDDWRRLLSNENLAQKVAEQFIASRAPIKVEPLLEFVGRITVPSTTGRFDAEMWFKLNRQANGLPQISDLGVNFKNWFMGKEEKPIGETNLFSHQLKWSSLDSPILTTLGGEERAETTLTAIFCLMSLQKTGQTGHLLNGYANIFYVRDVSGLLRAVRVHWGSGGWVVGAHPVGRPVPWGADDRVFSRNSGESLPG